MFDFFNFASDPNRRPIYIEAYTKTIRYMTLFGGWPKMMNISDVSEEDAQKAYKVLLQFCKRESVKSAAYCQGAKDREHEIYNRQQY